MKPLLSNFLRGNCGLTLLLAEWGVPAASHAPPRLRRQAREWGVVYEGEEEAPPPPAPPTP